MIIHTYDCNDDTYVVVIIHTYDYCIITIIKTLNSWIPEIIIIYVIFLNS